MNRPITIGVPVRMFRSQNRNVKRREPGAQSVAIFRRDGEVPIREDSLSSRYLEASNTARLELEQIGGGDACREVEGVRKLIPRLSACALVK